MDREFLIDLFSDFGPVTIRPMFSGFGISVDGVNFAMALRAGLYFRADEETIPQFEAEGSKPFQYQTRAKTVMVKSYWQLPARLFDDTEELSTWARWALGAAQRAAVKKRTEGGKQEESGEEAAEKILILRSHACAASRRMAAGEIGASWFETRVPRSSP